MVQQLLADERIALSSLGDFIEDTNAILPLDAAVALLPGPHDDQVRRHAAQHYKGSPTDRGGRHGDGDCGPIVL